MTQIGDELAAIFEPHQPLPIPTEYNGVKFRSRLEARWAVFMDAARIRWAYEFEGFQLWGGVWYVPDFWLPDLEVWLEIKPTAPTDAERHRCASLTFATQQRVCLAIGSPALPQDSGDSLICWGIHYSRIVGWPDDQRIGGIVDDSPYAFCECPSCGALGIEFEGRGDRVCGSGCTETDRGHTGHVSRFAKAVEAARVMRFW